MQYCSILTVCLVLVDVYCRDDNLSKKSEYLKILPKQQLINELKAQQDQPISWVKGKPIIAYVGIYIESLSNFLANDMSFNVDMYLRLSWKNKKLKHHREGEHYLLNEQKDLEWLWKPDVYFSNAKYASFQYVTIPNMAARIFADGSIYLSQRVTVNVACNLDLSHYPMDKQICEIRFVSYSYTVQHLILRWFPNDPIEYDQKIELAEFKINAITPDTCNGTYAYGHTESGHLIGNFSCLTSKIYLQRDIGYHMVQTFVPTGLIVLVSWVSFWIDPNATPARISLSFTTLLTLSTMAAGVRVSLPPVSYAKAIDVWIGTCTTFVFMALLEFAFVNSMCRHESRLAAVISECQKLEANANSSMASRRKSIAIFMEKNDPEITNLLALDQASVERLEDKRAKYWRYAQLADIWSQRLFPAAFILFNLFFWTLYYVITPN